MNNINKVWKRQEGFTLIEMLFVLLICMIILALSSFSYRNFENFLYTQYEGELKIKIRESQLRSNETGTIHRIYTTEEKIDFFMINTEPWYTFYMPENLKVVIDSYRKSISGVSFKENMNISAISYLKIETPFDVKQYTMNIGKGKFTNARKRK